MPLIEFGVDEIILQRVRAASARTKVAGSTVRSSWSYDRTDSSVAYNCTVPVGFKASLRLPLQVAYRPLNVVHETGLTPLMLWSSSEGHKNITSAYGIESVSFDSTNSRSAIAIGLAHGHFEFTISYL